MMPLWLTESELSRAIRLLAVSSACVAFVLGPGRSGQAWAAGDINGVWVTEDGESAIEIAACGSARCGRVTWLKDSRDEHGRPLLDVHNPDPHLRSRPICSLQIISGLKPQPDGAWGQGRIYDPDDGKSYDVEIQPAGTDGLKVTGYLGVKTLGETVAWHRAAMQLRSCNEL